VIQNRVRLDGRKSPVSQKKDGPVAGKIVGNAMTPSREPKERGEESCEEGFTSYLTSNGEGGGGGPYQKKKNLNRSADARPG